MNICVPVNQEKFPCLKDPENKLGSNIIIRVTFIMINSSILPITIVTFSSIVVILVSTSSIYDLELAFDHTVLAVVRLLGPE